MSEYLIGLRTLVLNANYMPISIFPLQTIPVEDAVTRVFNGTCRVVLEHNRDILTPNLVMKWPSVIARTETGKIQGKVKLSLEALYYRDHGICMYCEKELKIHEITCDHVVPKSKGGSYSWDNIVSACSTCNLKKGDHPPVGQWKPKQLPYKPSYFQLLSVRRKFPIVVDDANWMQFLGNWENEVIVRRAA